jgi:hypothetical protein
VAAIGSVSTRVCGYFVRVVTPWRLLIENLGRGVGGV